MTGVLATGAVIAALGALAACKAPVEKGPVTIDVQVVVVGATPDQMESAAGELSTALTSAEHGRRVRVIEQLGRLDLEVSYDRERVATAFAEVRAIVGASLEARSATIVVGPYDKPPDLIVHVDGTGAAGERAAAAIADVVPVIEDAREVARVIPMGAAPARWVLTVHGTQLATHGLTIVDVVAALDAAKATHGVMASPEALADVRVGDAPLFDVAGIASAPGDPRGHVDLAVWLGPAGTPGGVDDAIAHAEQGFAANGLVVTAGRAPGHSAPKAGDLEIAIITKVNPGIHGSLMTVASELARSHLVGTLVQQPPGADPRACSLALDLPDAGRARRPQLEAFVRAANGAPLARIAGRALVLGPLPDLAGIQLANPAGGSVPLSWAVRHDVLPATIQMYGQPALVFRTKLLPGKTLADVTAYVAKRTDLALIATVEARALDTPGTGT